MSEFIRYVLYQLQNSLMLVLLAGLAAAAVLAAVYAAYNRKYKGQKKFPWGKVFLWLIFLGYLIVVTYATMLWWTGFFHREWNLHLFRAWREAWNNFSAKNWANVLLNIAMFVPLGFLLPLLGKKFRNWYLTIPVGFGVSLAIELFQLAAGRGICDVDDLFCNALGAAMGCFCIMSILSLSQRKEGRIRAALTNALLFLLPIIAIGSLFGIYYTKEYGNLPEAAAYSVNLDHLEWQLECELADVTADVPFYRTRPMSKEDCDAFAEEMAALAGQEVLMASYYEEMAYYNLDRGILMVYYYDGSYEFGGFDHDVTKWDETDRETVISALEQYQIRVPEIAEFAAEGDGWYSFTCDWCMDSGMMLDGTLRVRYGVDDTVRRVENKLIRYDYYKDVAVISPEEAYRKVRNGAFAYAQSLKQHASNTVTVLSCVLDYEIDTKGFYQPIYHFEILIPETENTCIAIIPAMK